MLLEQTNTESHITENLVVFSPEIYVSGKEQVCQGILINSDTLKTTSACAIEAVRQQMQEPSEPVEVIGTHAQIQGQLIDGFRQTMTTIGLLKIFPVYLPQKEVYLNRYPTADQELSQLEIHYLQKHEGEAPAAVTESLTGTWEAGQLSVWEKHYPPGATVTKKQQFLCVIDTEGRCPAIRTKDSRLSKRQAGFCTNPTENNQYFYNCTDRVVERCGDGDFFSGGTFSGGGDSFVFQNGTCTNPVIGKRCYFFAQVWRVNASIAQEYLSCPTTCIFEGGTPSPNVNNSCICVAALADNTVAPPEGISIMYPANTNCANRNPTDLRGSDSSRGSAIETTASFILILFAAMLGLGETPVTFWQ